MKKLFLITVFMLYTAMLFATNYKVNVSTELNVRTEPNSSAQILGKLSNGEIKEAELTKA